MLAVISLRLPLTVVLIGRVCGTGIAIECTQVTPETANSSAKSSTVWANAFQAKAGSRENKELLTQRVVRDRQLEARGAVLGQVILLEHEDRPARPVIQQHVVVVHGHRLRVGDIA